MDSLKDIFELSISIRRGLQMLKKYNKMNDITKILIAMLLGSLLGILLGKRLPALVLLEQSG